MNTNGVTGTTSSGDRIVFSEVDKSIANERIPDTAGNYHTSVKLRIGINGQEKDLLFHLSSHTIINPDGTTKTENFHISQKCVGKKD